MLCLVRQFSSQSTRPVLLDTSLIHHLGHQLTMLSGRGLINYVSFHFVQFYIVSYSTFRIPSTTHIMHSLVIQITLNILQFV